MECLDFIYTPCWSTHVGSKREEVPLLGKRRKKGREGPRHEIHRGVLREVSMDVAEHRNTEKLCVTLTIVNYMVESKEIEEKY